MKIVDKSIFNINLSMFIVLILKRTFYLDVLKYLRSYMYRNVYLNAPNIKRKVFLSN